MVFVLIFATCAHIDPLFVNVRVTCKEKRLKEKLPHQMNANILQWYLNLYNEVLFMNGVIFSPPSCRSSLYEGRVGGVCGSSSVSSQQQLPASARGRSAPVAVYTQSWCWPPAAATLTTDTASSADSGSWSLFCDHQ